MCIRDRSHLETRGCDPERAPAGARRAPATVAGASEGVRRVPGAVAGGAKGELLARRSPQGGALAQRAVAQEPRRLLRLALGR